ncbi:MAG: creatininase family protein [Gemmatimonadota bacterium]|nr:MAG: creatininase family protein [Gemmatimonadota bacterium]
MTALEASEGTCALPLGVIEKHGPSGPIGTDLINIRYITALAAAEEYTVIFPEYYVGQITEAIHQPGTIAYSPRLQLDMLQETVSEMARNGCCKVILVNGHGGNNNLVQYLVQTQLASPRDYIVYAIMGGYGADLPEAARASGPGVDGHAGEGEISNVMASRPGLAHPERAATESGADQARLDLPDGVYTAIWWYASFPNHYGGNAAGATAARGEAATRAMARRLAEDIRAIKQDEVGPRLQRGFFDRMVRLNTPREPT